ncbi:DUF3139 domain-containing protein [Macrococcus brunensis]|uniref:DUF3139 domain-containing protein n=1 Tax=Macrococcus brunensis TaxID=198483 RepID=UPI001EEFE5C5|nr:DUF3139 domain-containing protein [Macrococcus brunensis]ULG73165.1 DUF3139 domain-containing protein [Macrococcus brunensis]
MTKKVTIGILCFVIILIALVGGFIMFQRTSLHSAVDNYLESKNATEKVESRSTKYDSKRNVFYEKVIFKDEPNLYYEIEKSDSKDKVFSTSYGKKGEVKGKYSN